MTDAEYQFELGRAYDKGYREAEALFMSMCSRDGVCGCHRWWHYPSRGEYPTEGETVLVAFQEGGLWYFANAEYHEGGWASVVDLGNIVAWQYIISPKEEA